MANHRDNNQRIRSVEPEIIDNPNSNGPSPSGLAMGLATTGRFPALREKLRCQLEALHARYETTANEYVQVATAEVVLMEQLTDEAKVRYDETVKWARKNGS